jgi:HTH-type transcriptional regulator / antitoxin HipB
MDYPLKTTEQLRQQLRSLRKSRRLTQAQLGALIGVTQARVVEIEANPGAVSLQQIMQVLHALGAGIVIRDSEADLVAADGLLQPKLASKATSITATRARKGSW